MEKEFWKKHLRRGLLIFIAVKIVMGLQNVIFQKPNVKETLVSHNLDTIYSLDTESFNILDKEGITFTLRPRGTCHEVEMVVMALSAPKNTEKREMLRGALGSRPGVRLIFLLGQTSQELQAQLQAENVAHGDLVQISVKDHYTALSYKTLSGFVWVNRLCGGTKYVVKVDDDIKLDINNLQRILNRKYGGGGETVPDFIECPSVMRNMRPWRQTHSKSIMSKWSISKEDMSRRVYPDFCPGWVYVTTPRVGLALAEVSVKNHHKLMKTARLDDIFVTGFLREFLPWVSLRQLNEGAMGATWNYFFSHCPYLGITKNIFFNDVVIDKGSNGVSYINGHKFYWCAFLEFFILENLELALPSLKQHTGPLWDICKRE